MKDENINVEKIVQLYQEGNSQREIAEKMELTPKKVQKVINDLRNQGQVIQRGKFIDDLVIKLYNNGKTQKEIAEIIGKTQKDVSLIIKRLKKDKQLEETEINDEEILQLRKEGKTMEEIGKKVGRSSKTISKILQRIYKETIMKLYNEGKTIEQIIELLDDIKIIYKSLNQLKIKGNIKERVPELEEIKDIKDKQLKEKERQKNEKEVKIIKLYKNGMTIKEIEKEIGEIPDTVMQEIKKIELENNIIKLYSEGKTPEEFSKDIGESTSMVYIIIKKLKQEGRICEGGKDIEEEKVRKLYKEGKTVEEISTITKTRISKLKQIIKKIEEEEKILILLNEGKDKEEIAKAFGRSVRTIEKKMRTLRKYGRLEERENYSNKDIQIMKLYDEGNNYKLICEKIPKLDLSTLSQKIQKFRFLGLVGDKEIDRSNDEKVINLYNEKKNNIEIAKELEMSPIIVSSILKRIKEEKIISAKMSQNPEIKVYFKKVESLIQVLKQQRMPTYEGIQSMNVQIQKEAIQRKQNIEKTIYDLRVYMKYVIDDDINKRVESKRFINMLYSNIIQKESKEIIL